MGRHRRPKLGRGPLVVGLVLVVKQDRAQDHTWSYHTVCTSRFNTFHVLVYSSPAVFVRCKCVKFVIAWAPEHGVETALGLRERNVAVVLRLSYIANQDQSVGGVRS